MRDVAGPVCRQHQVPYLSDTVHSAGPGLLSFEAGTPLLDRLGFAPELAEPKVESPLGTEVSMGHLRALEERPEVTVSAVSALGPAPP